MKFKNVVLHIIHEQRIEHIAAAFDSALKKKLVHQKTSSNLSIDRIIKRMSDKRKTTLFSRGVSINIGSNLSRITS